MKFNNEPTIYSIHVVKLIFAVLILLVLTLQLTTSFDDFIYRNIGLNQTWTLIILVLLYVLMLLYFELRKTSFFSYNDEGSKLVIRSYKVGLGSSKKLSFEIPKNIVYHYTIEKQKLKENLTIYIKIGTKISKYPSISISSITSTQKEGLIQSLNQYAEIQGQ